MKKSAWPVPKPRAKPAKPKQPEDAATRVSGEVAAQNIAMRLLDEHPDWPSARIVDRAHIEYLKGVTE